MAPGASGQDPATITDQLTDKQLRAYRAHQVTQLQRRAKETQPVKQPRGKTYEEIFFCTIYYTPKESGFTAARGFDVKPISARRLGGRKYPRDFLRAVKKEGFGRLITPVSGKSYLRYAGYGRYAFADAPLDRDGDVLIPRRSCAISGRNRFLRQNDQLIIRSEIVKNQIGNEKWVVTDTGGGVHRLQIDLYWGEDEPRGPIGRQRARPAGTWMEYAFQTRVTVQR
jgi:hypothetical protein